jgi:predicted alpha-1,6-mannanase (GH76 family)
VSSGACVKSASGCSNRDKLEYFLLLSILLCPIGSALPQRANVDSTRSQQAVVALQQWYVPSTGLYKSTGWWNSANAITALANFSRLAHTTEYLPVFANTLKMAQIGHDGAPGFLNKYYDDEGWWALAWIDVYDLTGETRYLEMAASIFKDMQLGWDNETCGGGVWWSKDKKDKNAIENELFLSVAASLANREKNAAVRAEDLFWMRKEWQWFRDSGMINASHLINDGLDTSNPARCTNNGKRTWTYNQGVILGGLVEMSIAEPKSPRPNASLLVLARQIATAAMEHLRDPHGALGEPDDAHDGADVPQFKGILVRNLMLLNRKSQIPGYRKFLIANANKIWSSNRNASDQFGFWWGGPFDLADAARQSSALDLLIAADAMGVSRKRR